MKLKLSGTLKYLLSVALAAGLLYFAFHGTDWSAFVHGLLSTRWSLIALSVAASVLALVFRAERWRSLLLTVDRSVSRGKVWHSSNVGNLLNVVIPGAGEFYRCGKVNRGLGSYDRVLGTVLAERAWDVASIAVLLVLSVLFGGSSIKPFLQEHVLAPLSLRMSLGWYAAAGTALVAAMTAAVFIFKDRSSFCAKAASFLKGILGGLSSFGKVKGKFLFLAYTAGIWLMYICVTYLTMLAIPGLEHLGFTDALFISATGNIASVIPTPGNIGPYHYLVGLSISTIYLGSGVMMPEALLCATLSHGVHAILLIILGIVSYIKNVTDNSKASGINLV